VIIKGAIFENSRKKDGDKQPDLNLKLEIDGVSYNVGAWKRRSKGKNTVYYSIFGDTDKDEEFKSRQQETGNNLDDDIPF
jgi:hypothetical protein